MPPTVALSVLPLGGPLRLTPTDVTQFVRLEQCERYLRFRLADRAGQEFMEPYGVARQRITPLLSMSGKDFEDAVAADLAARFRAVDYAAQASGSHARPANNPQVEAEAHALAPGQTILLFQVRLNVLDNRSQQPHMKLTTVDKVFGVVEWDEADGSPRWHATHPPTTQCESIPS